MSSVGAIWSKHRDIVGANHFQSSHMSPGCADLVVGAYSAIGESYACPQLKLFHSLLITVVNAGLVQNYCAVEIAMMAFMTALVIIFASYVFLRIVLLRTQDAREPPAILTGAPFLGPLIGMISERGNFPYSIKVLISNSFFPCSWYIHKYSLGNCE